MGISYIREQNVITILLHHRYGEQTKSANRKSSKLDVMLQLQHLLPICMMFMILTQWAMILSVSRCNQVRAAAMPSKMLSERKNANLKEAILLSITKKDNDINSTIIQRIKEVLVYHLKGDKHCS